MRSWQVVRLPRIPMTFPMYLREPNKVLMVNEEPRAAMVARLDTPLGLLTVANTHLTFVPGWNRVQLRHLVSDLRGFTGPRVLMGDLNITLPRTSAGSECARCVPRDLPRGCPATSARPHPHRRSDAARRRLPGPGVAYLGSSRTCCGRFAAVTT